MVSYPDLWLPRSGFIPGPLVTTEWFHTRTSGYHRVVSYPDLWLPQSGFIPGPLVTTEWFHTRTSGYHRVVSYPDLWLPQSGFIPGPLVTTEWFHTRTSGYHRVVSYPDLWLPQNSFIPGTLVTTEWFHTQNSGYKGSDRVVSYLDLPPKTKEGFQTHFMKVRLLVTCLSLCSGVGVICGCANSPRCIVVGGGGRHRWSDAQVIDASPLLQQQCTLEMLAHPQTLGNPPHIQCTC